MVTIQIPANVDGTTTTVGHRPRTTFWMDPSIAERFGIEAIFDTLGRAFGEWNTAHVHLTELVMILLLLLWPYVRRHRYLLGRGARRLEDSVLMSFPSPKDKS